MKTFKRHVYPTLFQPCHTRLLLALIFGILLSSTHLCGTTAATPNKPSSGKPPTVANNAPSNKAQSAAIPTGSDISVTVPDGQYLVWITQSTESGKPLSSTPILVSSREAKISLPGKGPARLWVLIPSQNKLAIVNATSGASITVTDLDFTRVYQMVVHVTDQSGKPLDYGRVEVRADNSEPQSIAFTPASAGDITFYNVPAGSVTIAASRGEEVTSKTTMVSPDSAVSPGLTIQVDAASILPVATSTPSIAATPTSTTHRGAVPEKSGPKHSSSSGLEGAIVALIVLGLLTGGSLWSVRNRKTLMPMIEAWLDKIGVHPAIPLDISNAPGSPDRAVATAPTTDPSVCPFCGTRKDPVTGCCACTLVPAGVATGTRASATNPASTSSMPGPRLVALEGPARSRIFELSEEITIGRDPTNTISLQGDTAASRRHARVLRTADQVEIVDDGSSNGTFVNGQRITRQTLQISDEILIGHSRFRYEG